MHFSFLTLKGLRIAKMKIYSFSFCHQQVLNKALIYFRKLWKINHTTDRTADQQTNNQETDIIGVHGGSYTSNNIINLLGCTTKFLRLGKTTFLRLSIQEFSQFKYNIIYNSIKKIRKTNQSYIFLITARQIIST